MQFIELAKNEVEEISPTFEPEKNGYTTDKLEAFYSQNSILLPKPKDIISKALGTILSTFEDINQMEVIKVRWEEIKKLQMTKNTVLIPAVK